MSGLLQYTWKVVCWGCGQRTVRELRRWDMDPELVLESLVEISDLGPRQAMGRGSAVPVSSAGPLQLCFSDSKVTGVFRGSSLNLQPNLSDTSQL